MTDYLLQLPESRKTRLLAALSYIGMLCLIPLIFGGNNAFIRFHVRQGLVLWAWWLLAIYASALGEVGGFFLTFSAGVIGLFSVTGLISVLLTRNWRLPVIAVLAEKL